MTLYVAKMLGTGDRAHDGNMGAGGLVQVQADGGDNTGEHAELDAEQQRCHDGGRHRDEIGDGIPPGPPYYGEVYKGGNRDDNGCRQGSLGQVIQHRRQQ